MAKRDGKGRVSQQIEGRGAVNFAMQKMYTESKRDGKNLFLHRLFPVRVFLSIRKTSLGVFFLSDHARRTAATNNASFFARTTGDQLFVYLLCLFIHTSRDMTADCV